MGTHPIFESDFDCLTERYSAKKMNMPSWTDQVKTASFKELAPYDADWYYIRCASIARHLYVRGGAGVGAFRKIYGGAQDRGTQPSRFQRAHGNVIRKCLQSLEQVKIVRKGELGGRAITPAGQRDMDRVAAIISADAK